jgi:hypothetical protein
MVMTHRYASLSEVKAAARITDTIDDVLLETAIESSSRDIDAYTERVFFNTGATAVTRVYIPENIYLLETDDIISVTSIKSDTTGEGGFDLTWTATDYQLEPLNGIAGGITTPFTRIRAIGSKLWPIYEPRDINAGQASVQIVARFGFSSIPSAIKQATILASLRAYKRYESPTGVLGFSDVGVVRIGRLDPDVERLIQPYRKLRMA